MFDLIFEKVYSKEFEKEPYFFAFPLEKGRLFDINKISVSDCPIQAKATAFWDDGSIKWAFVRSEADLPANGSRNYVCRTDGQEKKICEYPINANESYVDTGDIRISVSTDTNKLFDEFIYKGKNVNVSAPVLLSGCGKWDFKVNEWTFEEKGALCVIMCGKGNFTLNDKKTAFIIKLTFYAGKPWFEIALQLINTTDDSIDITGLYIDINNSGNSWCTGISNYKTKIEDGSGNEVYTKIDAEYLKYESNEHNPEVFYGTFFGESRNDDYGICATVFQAQQNYPKAIRVNKDGIRIYLVPEDECIILKSGMARQQKMQLHVYPADTDIQEVNHRSTVYQMPVRPFISPEVFKNSGVFENVFTESPIGKYEMFLIGKSDEHARCYGMLNWGDVPDGGYTSQGRGNGRLVWTNNEYDYPHAAMLMYARTGIRRYMDYVLVAARHWTDVDVCHYSNDPLIMGGQYEHCAGHIDDKKIVCSHQWVEGLIDCYHLTGEKEYFDTAVGIGENVLRLLDTPMFKQSGQANARETGWALRTLCALYKETGEERWLEKCNWIVGHFEEWEKEYGLWLAPYMDNTAIRVVFMISIAACSLMRYYRIDPQPRIKGMILRAVDDLVDNARLDNGLFYYKELPSLKRLGNNPIILEALTYAYELTGNVEYLKVGLPTFEFIRVIKPSVFAGGNKSIVEDALLCGSMGTKGFAQMMVPFTVYYSAASKEGLV